MKTLLLVTAAGTNASQVADAHCSGDWSGSVNWRDSVDSVGEDQTGRVFIDCENEDDAESLMEQLETDDSVVAYSEIITPTADMNKRVLVYHDDPLTDPGCFPPVDVLEIDNADADDIAAAIAAEPEFADWLAANSREPGDPDWGLNDRCFVGTVSLYDFKRHDFRCSSIEL